MANLSVEGSLRLGGKDWYYGPISRVQCDSVLNTRGHDGDFLIRDSETNVGGEYLFYYYKICIINLFLFNIY